MSGSIKNSTILIYITAAIVIAFLLIDNKNKAVKIKELKKDIDDNEDLTKEIKVKLTALIENNADIDSDVAIELGQIAALLEIKQDASAVLKLAKIIENLLKELYKNDPTVKAVAKQNNRKSPSFADYIEHCRNEKIITPEEYHFLSVLKIIRNEEAHEINVKKDKSRIVSSFISGVGIILALCKLLKKNKPQTPVVEL